MYKTYSVTELQKRTENSNTPEAEKLKITLYRCSKTFPAFTTYHVQYKVSHNQWTRREWLTRGVFLDAVEGVGLLEPLGQHKHWPLDEDGSVIPHLDPPLGEGECSQATNSHSLQGMS